MTLKPKTRISHYEIHSTLGKGGMGEVYLARDTSIGRMVAIKVLAAEIVPDPKRMRRFEQEARAVSSLNHPNILTIYESGQVDSMRFIAMEYVVGKTLREYLDEATRAEGQATPGSARRMKLRDVLQIAIQIAAALDAAHEAKVVHRDIKPENVMIRGRGHDLIVKVIDFGLAKLVEKPVSTQTGTTIPMLTQPGAVIGTVSYMSPEQTAGSDEVDHRSDIWSLGVVLYEMITGRLPFEGKDIHRQVIAIQELDQPRLATYAPGVPERLEEIVAKVLAKNPDERYQSAKDLLIDLRSLIRKLEIAAEIKRTQPPGPNVPEPCGHDRSAPAAAADSVKATSQAGRFKVYQAISAIKRYRLAAGIISGVVLAATVGIYLLTRPAPVQIVKLTHTGKVQHVCISPEGKSVAYVSWDAGKESLMLTNKENSSEAVQLVPPIDKQYWDITFSPDGNYVYYLIRDLGGGTGSLYRVAVSNNAQEKLIDDVDSTVTFSPDGKEMAFIRWHGREWADLLIANVDRGKAETDRVLATSTAVIFNGVPSWSPDGQVVACPIWDKQSRTETIVGVHVSDRVLVNFTQEHWDEVGRTAWSSNSELIIIAGKTNSKQIWSLSYSNGQVQPITADHYDYTDVSLIKDSSELVTVQSSTQSNVYLAPAGDTTHPKKLTDGIGIDGRNVSWMKDGRILYDSPRNGNLDIWVVNPDGSQPRPLTSGPPAQFFPSASSDYIVFVSDQSGTNQVWRMNDNSTNLKLLSYGDTPVNTPVLTPDGKWVIFEMEGIGGLWKIPIDGDIPKPFINNDVAFRPAVDPKGERVAYWFWNGKEGTENRHVSIGVTTFSGGPPASSTIDVPKTANYTANLQWSKDGKAILYVDTSGGIANIWSQPVDGGKPQQITHFTTGGIFSFAYSPDGTYLAFTKVTIPGDVVLITNLKNDH